MLSTINGRPLTVQGGEGTGSYLILPYESLDTVRSLLEANNVPHYVYEEVLSIDDGPETAQITFSRKVDRAAVQRLLDSVP